MTTNEIMAIAQDIDAEARQAHLDNGGSIQGWDPQYKIKPGGILRVDGEEIDLSEASQAQVRVALRGCYAVLDNTDPSNH